MDAPPSDAPAGSPTVTVSDAASTAIRQAAEDAGTPRLRIAIGARFEHELYFDAETTDGDIEIPQEGFALVLDPASAERAAEGLNIELVDGPQGSGFRIDNPKQPATVRQLGAPELKAMLDRGAALQLLDVRTEQEWAIARIEGARLLDEAAREEVLGLDRDTTLVFQCHHGMRSQSAAQYFLGEGFRKVYNLSGGIDAWSRLVDPAVPRY